MIEQQISTGNWRFGLAMRLVMTALWIMIAAGGLVNDFNASHLFNPGWPPHARLHMMSMLTSGVALALFGLYLCWGPAASRLQSIKLSALLGFLFTLGLVVACLTIPMYGGSMDPTDIEMRPATFANENFLVFVNTTCVFALLLIAVHWRRQQ